MQDAPSPNWHDAWGPSAGSPIGVMDVGIQPLHNIDWRLSAVTNGKRREEKNTEKEQHEEIV